MAAVSRQQQAFGLRQPRGWCQNAQSQDADHDPSNVFIGRHQTFDVQLTERDMQCPLIRPDLAQTVQRQIDTLADADSGGTSK